MALSSERATGGVGGSGVSVATSSVPGTFPGSVGQPPPLPPPLPPASPAVARRRRLVLPLLMTLLLVLVGVAALTALPRSRDAGPARLAGRAAAWCRQLWKRATDSAEVATPAATERPSAAASVSALRYPIASAKAVASQMVARTAGNMADWRGGNEAAPTTRTHPAAATTTADPSEPAVRTGTPTAAPPKAPVKATVIWPDIVLTAVMGSGTKGVAHINGEVITTGERSREGLILKGVEGQGALIELDGEQRYVPVNGSRQRSRQPVTAPKGRRR